MSLEKSPDRGTTPWNSLLAHRHNDLVQGQIRLLGYQSQQPIQFGWIHEIACPSENEIYVAELLNWRVQKLILHPGQQKAGR